MNNNFFIVNDFDRPEEECIAQKFDFFYLYIHPLYKNHGAMIHESPTPIEDFGIAFDLDEDGIAHGKVVGESRATYSDGNPRRWQGSSEFSFEINRPLDNPIMIIENKDGKFKIDELFIIRGVTYQVTTHNFKKWWLRPVSLTLESSNPQQNLNP